MKIKKLKIIIISFLSFLALATASTIGIIYVQNKSTQVEQSYGAATAGSTTTSGYFKFTSNGDGTCYVENGSATGSVSIPSTSPAGDRVTSIGYHGFYQSGITGITIPSSVEIIGEGSFYECTSLTNVSLSSGVTTIKDRAFARCSSLESITIPSSVITIEDSAFYDAGLTNITIPSSVTSIGNYAFTQCSLKSVVIPSSVTNLGKAVFSECVSLTSIKVDSANTKYTSRDNSGNEYNVVIDKSTKTLVLGCNKSTIPSDGSVTSIGDYSFYGCTYLEEINIPSNITSIGKYSFYWCFKLDNVVIPNSVTSIGNTAFFSCSALTSINIPSKITIIEESTFAGCSKLTTITIPSSVTSIGRGAFSSCSKLISVRIENASVYAAATSTTTAGNLLQYAESIGVPKSIVDSNSNSYLNNSSTFKKSLQGNSYSFVKIGSSQDYLKFTSNGDGTCWVTRSSSYNPDYQFGAVVIPEISPAGDRVVEIAGGYGGFYGCHGITSLTIPSSVTTMSSQAFEYCTGLTSITVPSSVTSIGSGAFRSCTSLKTAKIYASANIDSSILDGCTKLKASGGIVETSTFKFTSKGDGTCTVVKAVN